MKIAKENFLIGCEFEFYCLYDMYETENEKTQKILKKLKKELKNVFFTEDNISVHADNSRFKLTFDRSIREKNENFIVPLELITPVLNLKNIENLIEKIFFFIKNNNLKTNKTTGLHVNLSFLEKEKNKKIDPLKLIFLSNDVYLEKKWQREEKKKKEIYFKTNVDPNILIVEKILEEKITNNKIFDFNFFLRNYPENFLNILNSKKYKESTKLWLDKKQSINIKKLFDYGYVEFRILGGENYHLRKEEIVNEIMKFCKILEISTNVENNKKVIKKIYKLIDKIFENKKETIKNEKINFLLKKYDFIFSNEKEFKYLVKKWLYLCENNKKEESEEIFKKLTNKKFKCIKYFPNTIKNFFFSLKKELQNI